jgi:hypothetical protein
MQDLFELVRQVTPMFKKEKKPLAWMDMLSRRRRQGGKKPKQIPLFK